MRDRNHRRARLGPPLLAWLACSALAGDAASATPVAQRYVAVGWSDSGEARGWVQRFGAREPWAFEGAAIPVGPNPTLRFAAGRLYAVSDRDGTIVEIDCTSWSATRSYALGAGSEPLDIAVLGETLAYVTTRSSSELLALDLETGALRAVLDFRDLGLSGVLVPGMMALDAGRLLVQLSRFDAFGTGFAAAAEPSAFLAVVDLATEALVDADPLQAGTQPIALRGTFPKYKMSVLRDARRLYLSASGAYFDEGGLEAVDLDALASVGLPIAEADGNTAADLGSFAMVALERGYLVSSTDFVASSHLARFSLDAGVVPEELFVSVDYRVPNMVHDPQTDALFVPEGGFATGVWVFSAATGEAIGPRAVALAGTPSDVELLCDPHASCDCAVGYGCEAVPAASSLRAGLLSLALALAAAGRIARRRARAARPRRAGSAPFQFPLRTR